MNEEKEFKKEEYKIELKCVAILSVDDINELKLRIPELIKDRISNYNYPYIIAKNDSMNTMSCQVYIKCKISKYEGISQQEKEYMNGEVADIRKNFVVDFSPEYFAKQEEQMAKVNDIYYKLEKEVEKTFNNSEYLKELMENSWLEYHEKEKEKR
jgi:hypothetical protein